MSTTNENKQQEQQKTDKKEEKPKELMELMMDFIKNPAVTGISGLAAGYLIGTYKASKDLEALKVEYKQQMNERDDQFKLLVKQIQATNRLIASNQLNGHRQIEQENEEDDENMLEMEEDKKIKAYKYIIKAKKKQQFQIQG